MKFIKGKSKVVLFWLVTVCLLPITQVFAQAGTGVPKQGVGLNNPLKVKTLGELLEALLAVVMVLATPIIVFFIIYAGFLYVTAQGNASKVEEATKALTYAVIGGVIVLGSFAVISIIKNLVGSFV